MGQYSIVWKSKRKKVERKKYDTKQQEPDKSGQLPFTADKKGSDGYIKEINQLRINVITATPTTGNAWEVPLDPDESGSRVEHSSY